MAKNLEQTGVLQVNGAWATSLKYESEVLGARQGVVDLRFMQGRSEIARASLLTEEIAEVIGENNAARISRHLAGDADKYLAVIKGELRGSRLEFKQVHLEENSIGIENTPKNERVAARSSRSEERPATSDAPAPPAEPAAVLSSDRASPVPQRIVAKYLVKHDKYYFDDQTVAFVDRGSRLSVQTQNTAVIKDLIEIAKSRDWQRINVTGTKEFRREVWKEASASGVKVSGYSPTALEQEAADKMRLRRSEAAAEREIDAVSSAVAGQAPSPSPMIATAKRDSYHRASDPGRGMVYGTLVDHGEAPYRNDPSKSASYFVTIKDTSGNSRTHWGVGLATAMRQAQSSPQVGDEVGIRRVGSTPVTILERAAEGETQIASPIATKRHQWLIEKAELLRQAQSDATRSGTAKQETPTMVGEGKVNGGRSEELTPRQEAAAAIRSARTTREELQLKYPDLNRAVFEHLASHDQFADAYVKAGLIRESDRAQVIAQMRERLARGVEAGTNLKEPDDKQVKTLIRRSVGRVAADIGRPPVEVAPRAVSVSAHSREDMQVRG
jgi:Large polyvalent protein-associated domain 7